MKKTGGANSSVAVGGGNVVNAGVGGTRGGISAPASGPARGVRKNKPSAGRPPAGTDIGAWAKGQAASGIAAVKNEAARQKGARGR